MSQTTKDEFLMVSHCHHAGFKEVMVKDKETGRYKGTGKYICTICDKPTKPLELLVEAK